MKVLFYLLTLSAWATDHSLDLQKIQFGADQEGILEIRYELECAQQGEFRGIEGELALEGRTLRFELWEGTQVARLQLGRVENLPANPKLTLEDNETCKVKGFDYQFQSVESERDVIRRLALKHSPVLHIRDDQFGNRRTDLPLAIGYSVKETPNKLTIIYTAFFSDEDSLNKVSQMDSQMTRYGRRTDIEWVYEADFLPTTLHPIGGSFHTAFLGELGHAKAPFAGTYLPGTSHPILYNLAKHNVFSDHPSRKQAREAIAYHLPPLQSISEPAAREQLMVDHPWLFFHSDLESKREKKLSKSFASHLFVRVRGKLKSGSFKAKVAFDNGQKFESPHGNVDRLGEDLWGKESYTAVPMDEKSLQGFGKTFHGTLSLSGKAKLSVEEIGVLIPTRENGRTVFKDVTDQVTCELNSLASVCRF